MSQTPDNADLSMEEQLVAYLDGELEAEEARRIEELLSNNPQLRQTLQQLDHTWELLDELDTQEVAENFTQTTLEMVAVAAADDVRQSLAEAPRRRRRRWALVGGSLLAAGLVGFLAVIFLLPNRNPNRQLVEDLPLLLEVEQYRQIDDFHLLQMLREEGLFVEEDVDQAEQEVDAAQEDGSGR
ncbi:MAG: hypothetical protein JXB62_07825 [Pirellulales bacterium]|nr:hypothetical protein [Pirellulales bacterium]